MDGLRLSDSQLAAAAGRLQDAVVKIGSQSATARLLGLSQSAVSKWLSKGALLPAEYVLAIEEASGVPRYDLRPDLYRPEPKPARNTVTHVDTPAPGTRHHFGSMERAK